MKGLWLHLSPFAPDQSGASAVLYGLGGIIVICDAGGCAGNICGFDEPRWFTQKSAIFSAGLRDMDAILGRDDKLIEKLALASGQVEASFAAIIGTPVPAVIGTDYKALKRMAEHKLHLPILTVDTNGTRHYDEGAAKAYLELFAELTETNSTKAKNSAADTELTAKTDQPAATKPTAAEHQAANQARNLTSPAGPVGVLGATPLDMSSLDAAERLQKVLQAAGYQEVYVYGMDGKLASIRKAGQTSKNIVAAPSGLKAAQYLQAKFGTPYEFNYPLAGEDLTQALTAQGLTLNPAWQKILIVHQQVAAHSLRRIIRQKLPAAQVQTATWFLLPEELREEGDLHLTEEDQFSELVRKGHYDCIIGDSLLQRAVPFYQGAFLNLPHFAVSGKM